MSVRSSLKLEAAWDQIQGCRFSQQDRATCIRLGSSDHLFVLADGAGGRVAGDVASETVLNSFCSAIEACVTTNNPHSRMAIALKSANLSIRDRVNAIPELAGMASTLTAATICGRELHWISVGDSPLWLFRPDEVCLLNSICAHAPYTAHRRKILKKPQAKHGRSLAFDVLFGDTPIAFKSSSKPEILRPGDVVILASDGVDTLNDDELSKIVYAWNDSVSGLVQKILLAIERHNNEFQDNATVIALQVTAHAK